jgi:hypothetical protein
VEPTGCLYVICILFCFCFSYSSNKNLAKAFCRLSKKKRASILLLQRDSEGKDGQLSQFLITKRAYWITRPMSYVSSPFCQPLEFLLALEAMQRIWIFLLHEASRLWIVVYDPVNCAKYADFAE